MFLIIYWINFFIHAQKRDLMRPARKLFMQPKIVAAWTQTNSNYKVQLNAYTTGKLFNLTGFLHLRQLLELFVAKNSFKSEFVCQLFDPLTAYKVSFISVKNTPKQNKLKQ